MEKSVRNPLLNLCPTLKEAADCLSSCRWLYLIAFNLMLFLDTIFFGKLIDGVFRAQTIINGNLLLNHKIIPLKLTKYNFY